MYKIIQTIAIALVICSSALAGNKTSAKNIYSSKTQIAKKESSDKTNIFISPIIGFRHDILRWSFGGDGLPKLSELTWKNKIAEIGAEILTEPKNNQYNFLGSIKYGKILDDSEKQDSDWDQLGEFSRTISKVKGNTFDASGAIGVSEDRLSKFPYAFITYYLGFDYNYSNFRNFGINHKINRMRFTPFLLPTGQSIPNSKLISTYKYHNFAPWFGTKLHYNLNNKLSFSPLLKAYLFVYKAEADWILRDDFQHNPSFEQSATGVGFSLDAELLYKAKNYLDIHANIGIKKLTMLKGEDKTYLSNGVILSFPLKELTLLSKTVSIGARYKF